MPRFELHLHHLSDDEQARALDAVMRRFPEVEPVGLRRGGDGDGSEIVWECRAPTASHLERWVAEVGLPTRAISELGPDGKPVAPPA